MAWTKMHTAIVVGAVVLLAAGTATITFKQNRTRDTNSLTLTNSQNIKIIYSNKADKDYMASVFALFKIKDSNAPDRMERYVDGAWALSKEYPSRPNGYQCIMEAITDYPFLGKPDRARALAQELIDSSAPDNFKQWAKGFLYRLDSLGKPVEMQFTAVDGTDVDLVKMKGKVVLVYFWQGGELPQVKAAWEKYHAQGFEVIGISCNMGKTKFDEYFKQNKMLWPQYSEGKQANDNKFTLQFGIDGIPYLFLVDKKGCLRFDDVDAKNYANPKGDGTTFEQKISKLLAED
jgi:hypothetical protein